MVLNHLDGSGWSWFIPLHDDTVSIGIVMNQDLSTKKKKESNLSGRNFYLESIKQAPGISSLLAQATLDQDVKSAADWSYSATKYGSQYVRLVGDAGAFLDPLFSSGIHMALSGALSAAVTICASIRGDCDEAQAWKWHSTRVKDRFARFLLVVMGAAKQIQMQDIPVWNNLGDDGFDAAFHIVRPSMLLLLPPTLFVCLTFHTTE
jgi:flavin-dependent dehydrogenase